VNETETIEQAAAEQEAIRPPRRKFPWAILIVVAVFIIVPFISWYGTWFGRPLSDQQLDEYLHDAAKPRHMQHALWQLGERIGSGDQSLHKWYPAIIETSRGSVPEVRSFAAVTMGQDNSSAEFHQALLSLLSDSVPVVRHNAALQLVRFNDSAGREELVAMLKPWSLKSEAAGKVSVIVKEGAAFAAGAPVLRIKRDDGSFVEERAPEAGRVERVLVGDGAAVNEGDEIAVLYPEIEQVESALRALSYVGMPSDIPVIAVYSRGVAGMPERIQKQAALTAADIRERAESKK